MNSKTILYLTLLGLTFVKTSSADILEWNFSIDEQQIKNGPEADGSTNSPGTGTGVVEYDTDTNTISYSLQWEGLVGDLTKLHIHGPAGPDSSNPQHVLEIFGPPAVPDELVATSGSVTDSHELLTLVQPGFPDLEPHEIIDIMTSGMSYLNVHTTVFGTGEIRGNLGVPLPEPSTVVLSACGLLAFGLCRRKR